MKKKKKKKPLIFICKGNIKNKKTKNPFGIKNINEIKKIKTIVNNQINIVVIKESKTH